MAPEIIFHKPYDYRIDIWAVGVLLYELMHGFAPFRGKTFKEVEEQLKIGDVQFAPTVSQGAKLMVAEVL